MDTYSVKRLALVLAIQSDIEGMKAENQRREHADHAQAYDEIAFDGKAEELRVLASMHDDQL